MLPEYTTLRTEKLKKKRTEKDIPCRHCNQKEADTAMLILDILDIKERSHAKSEKVMSIVTTWAI